MSQVLRSVANADISDRLLDQPIHEFLPDEHQLERDLADLKVLA